MFYMRKLFYLCVSFFIFFQGFSQAKGGEVVYKVIMQEDSLLKKTMRPRIRENYENAEKMLLKIKPNLIFNDSTSVFGLNLKENRSDNAEFALKLIDCDKAIYTNINTSENIFNNPERKAIFKKDEFLVTKKIEDNWKLSNETKIINNFKCFKATQQVSIKNDVGTFYRTITAWYCPELPYTFGPKGYSGLPGLIFELQDRNVVFGIESVKFFDDKVVIKFPTQGVKINYDEYQATLKERVLKRMDMTESFNKK